MSASQSPIDLALDKEHLQAIGSVAASWSMLETSVIWSVSLVAGMSREQAVTFLAPMDVRKWLEIMQALTAQSKDLQWKAEQLKKICDQIASLQPLRNSMLHGHWLPRLPSFPGIAWGAGLRKNIKNAETNFHYTAEEMISIATQIQEARQSLDEWLDLRPST